RNATFAAVRAALNAASNRRSSEIASTLASLRSRSTIVRRLLISSRLVGSALSQPYSTHFSKLILISDQKDLFPTDDRIQKVISAGKLCFELRNRIDGGIDRAPKRSLNLPQLPEHLFEGGSADDEQVNVALCFFRPTSFRAIDEGYGNSVGQGHQCCAQRRNRSDCLGNQGTEFREHGMIAICAIKDLLANI